MKNPDQRRRGQLHLVLIGLTGLAISLLLFRFYWSGTNTYWSLTWNLLLAAIPFAISTLVLTTEKWIRPKLLVFPIVALWLLFFPNAPYIITDLFHLQTRGGMPKWFDLLMVMTFAWTGLTFGIVSLMDIQRVLSRLFNKSIGWIVAIGSIVLGSFGVYLGRFLRWNSWDILTSPKPLARDIYHIVLDPLAHPRTIGMTITFSAFLLLVYLTLKYVNVERQA